MKFKRINRYFHTLRYMKKEQIWYRIYYTLRNRYRKKTEFHYPLTLKSQSRTLALLPSIPSRHMFTVHDGVKSFTFLNLEHSFKEKIDWNFTTYGKLWTYNLTYFEYLLQEEIKTEDALALMEDFISSSLLIKDGLEPFPIALRGINWIKFLTYHNIKRPYIDDALYAQYEILMDNIEYHLLGNHLLENGFSLLFGAYYFADERLLKKAREILEAELHEQILEDGAHFELTPMYHQLMLYRLLDCVNLVSSNDLFKDEKFLGFLSERAELMLGWLERMRYHDGTVAHFNDSTDGIAPTTDALITYAKRLGLNPREVDLGESGYRKFTTDRYEMVVDVGNIGPDYIPGHAHSDTFNFELRVFGKPLIVDTGISTYETNARRAYERGTAAHNTVVVDGLEQSEVWASFRVARRAKIVNLYEENGVVEATHNGYRRIGVLHTRKFRTDQKQIVIVDRLQSHKVHEAVAYLHFAANMDVSCTGDDQIVTSNAIFSFKGLKKLELVDITIAHGYNDLVVSKAAKIYFDKVLTTTVDIIDHKS